MKNCKECGNKIPSYIKIDNRVRNLKNRIYCLDCSPFGLHNTRKIDHIRQEGKECICQRCNKSYVYQRGKGVTTIRCASCNVTSSRDRIKTKAVLYKGGCCQRCGYNRCINALVFHHINPEDKEFSIGGNYNKAWSTIQRELEKCELLCHNCHAEHHANENAPAQIRTENLSSYELGALNR